MTAITTKSRQMRLDNCVFNTTKRVQIVGNLLENACKDREAATPADAANAGLENNGKIRKLHPNTKILGKYRLRALCEMPRVTFFPRTSAISDRNLPHFLSNADLNKFRWAFAVRLLRFG